jgi:cytochrome b involved in lipid metabolism
MKKPIIIVFIILALIAIVFVFGKKQEADVLQEATVTPAPQEEVSGQPTFTAADVAAHNKREDCYAIVGTNVYNLTAWVSRHPGGEAAILGICGKDATAAFGKQHGDNTKAQAALASFFIGILK